MPDSKSFYYEAARLLCFVCSKRATLKSAFYSQDGEASCIPVLVLLNVLKFNKSQSVEILDACAAPGNKTTLLLSGLKKTNQTGRVVAIDRDPKRFKQLCNNLRRIHDGPVKVNGKVDGGRTQQKSSGELICEANCRDFLSIDPVGEEEYCNIKAILVDPTCSGSGLCFKSPELLAEKEEGEEKTERIRRLANLQAKILRHALSFPNVDVVVYSTCSIYKEENEAVVREQAEAFAGDFHLTTIWKETAIDSGQENPFAPIAPWKSRGFADTDDQKMSRCLRSSPEKDLTIGFFVSCFKRRKHTKKTTLV
ncbi:unnamed protein product [Mesocestoides corti]|uniref:SAM-dependent MTase RsmB/NOP-type domain-containing protein n=1 Tax=Mesocestoides corti TaxID=53468 RepID=A0A0R3UID9_MESCO|nr:unnamed protein product [Mesocestoides corti]